MTTITSTANGNWSATGTWVGGVVPTTGDTVIMNHNLTVDVDTSVGTSGAAGTLAIDMNTANKVLTINTGCELTLRGDFMMRGSFATKTNCLTMNAGSGLIFNSVLAASPSTTSYVVRPQSGGTGASILISGSAGSRCSVSSDPGGANGRFSRNGFNATGQFYATYTDFTDIGDASNPFYEWGYGSNGITATQAFSFQNCILDGCGQINVTNSANSGTIYDVNHCTFRNTAHATRCISLPAFTVTGTRVFSHNVCDKDVFVGDGAWDLTQTQFHESYTTGARSVAATQVGILLRKTTQPTTNLAGDISDSYILKDGTIANPHWISCSTWNRAFTITGNVFAYTGTSQAGDVMAGGNTATARVHTVSGNIQLPIASGSGSGKFISNGGGANVGWDVYHNTYAADRFTTGAEIACSYGESYAGHALTFPNVRSNLAWSPTAGQAIVLLRYTGSVQLTTGATTTHNGTWNGYAGTDGTGYDSYSVGAIFSGTAPGANDVDVTTDPFIDWTRSMATWDAHLGGPGTTANALAELAKFNDPTGWNSDYNVPALVAWVREGFKVTGTAGEAFEDAGHDGVTIGAMPFEATGSPVIVPADPATVTISGQPATITITSTAPPPGGGTAVGPPNMLLISTSTVTGTYKDVSEYRYIFERADGMFGREVTYPVEAVPGKTAPARLSSRTTGRQRVVTVTGHIKSPTPDLAIADMRALTGWCDRAVACTSGHDLNAFLIVDAIDILPEFPDPQMISDVVRVRLIITAEDPRWYSKTLSAITVTTDTPLPVGEAVSDLLIRMTGAMTNPALTLKDHTGAVVATLGLTLTLPGASDYVEIDSKQRTIVQSISGVITDAIGTRTSGDFFQLDPRHAVAATSSWATLTRSYSSGSGTVVATFRKCWY